jgi:threonine dehydratase
MRAPECLRRLVYRVRRLIYGLRDLYTTPKAFMNFAATFTDIEAAAGRIAGGIQRTPCAPSPALSEATGCEIFCKLEYLQRTGSFKERGARNALLLLDKEAQARGVIAASAGNHALGLAYHGALLGVPVTVVMPVFAPLTKISNCRQFGANVLLCGDDIAQARGHADELATQRGLTYINGYDDPAIIAGQGTIGLEILQQVPDVDAVIVPVGGGGLIAGIALAIKTLRPDVQIIGVEPQGAASYQAALQHGAPQKIAMQPTLADGLAVPCFGRNAFGIARQLVDRHLTVSEHLIALAVLRLLELEKAVVEGAGAAGLAALLSGALDELRGRKVVLPLCGGNIDMPMLGRVIERGLAADGRLCRCTVSISDRPGGLARFAALVAEEGASIHDIVHDRAFAGDDLTRVAVHCIIETRNAAHQEQLRARLAHDGFTATFPDL